MTILALFGLNICMAHNYFVAKNWEYPNQHTFYMVRFSAKSCWIQLSIARVSWIMKRRRARRLPSSTVHTGNKSRKTAFVGKLTAGWRRASWWFWLSPPGAPLPITVTVGAERKDWAFWEREERNASGANPSPPMDRRASAHFLASSTASTPDSTKQHRHTTSSNALIASPFHVKTWSHKTFGMFTFSLMLHAWCSYWLYFDSIYKMEKW